MTHSIEARNLRLRYSDDAIALDDVSFKLDGGKIYGLLGRNGAGKTSLLSLMAAFRKPTEGEVLVNGQPVWENPAVTRDICLIRETADTVAHSEKVKAALEFAAYTRPNWDGEYARALLERFGVSLEQKIDQLSRGKRAALWVTLGLASRAPVTMFDEPYIGMDAPSRQMFYDEILKDFMEYPRTIIVSTHLIEEVAALFEDVIIIDRGKLLLHEETDTLLSRGASITGPAEVVDRLADGLTVLNSRQLGPTKAIMVYGDLNAERLAAARSNGLELGPVALQDLFIHLTNPTGDER